MIKKILATFLLSSLAAVPVFAEEVTELTEASQVVEVADNKAAILFVKQPATESPSQKVVVTKNWFSIILVLNGKAVENLPKGE